MMYKASADMPVVTSKNPTRARFFSAFVAMVAVLCSSSVKAESAATSSSPDTAGSLLNEAEVIRLARSKHPAASVAQARQRISDARAQLAAPLPNPTIEWTRESVETGPVGSQDFFVATFSLDIAGPRTERALIAADVASSQLDSTVTRAGAVVEALLAYYGIVFAEQRVDLLADAAADLDEAARVLRSREAVGRASGYESARLIIASQLSRSQLAQARAEVDGEKSRLAILLDLPGPIVVQDTSLKLAAMDEVAGWALLDGRSNPSVQKATRSQQRSQQAVERSKLTWIPTIDLSAGMTHVNQVERGYGYVLGVSLGLPVFDRGQALRGRARAAHMLASARSNALRQTINAEAARQLLLHRSARDQLEQLEANVLRHVTTLVEAARSGYREGERTIVELLDAQRTQTEVAQRRLDLRRTAKFAEIRLRSAAGELP